MGDFEQFPPTKKTNPSWSDRSKRAARYTISKAAVAVGAVFLVTIAFFVAEPEEPSTTRRNTHSSDRTSLSLPPPSDRFQPVGNPHTQGKNNIRRTTHLDNTPSSPALAKKNGIRSRHGNLNQSAIDLSQLDPACSGHCTEEQHSCFYDCERNHKIDSCLQSCTKYTEKCSLACNGPACTTKCHDQERSCNDDCGSTWIRCRKDCNQTKEDCLQICKPLQKKILP